MLLKTRPIVNDYALIKQRCIPSNLFNKLYFNFKGRILEKNSVYSQAGIGMDSPLASICLSDYFSIESNDDGQFAYLVTCDGLSVEKLPLPESYIDVTDENLNPINARVYEFALENDVLRFFDSSGTFIIKGSCVPKIERIRSGMSFGLKTLNPEVKRMSIKNAMVYGAL